MITIANGGTIAAVCGTGSALTYTLLGMELSGATETYKVLAQGQVPTSAATIYTISVDVAFIKEIRIANTTGNPVSGFILYVDGTASSNQLTGSLVVPANGAFAFNEGGLRIYDGVGNLISSPLQFTQPTLSFGSSAAAGSSRMALSSNSELFTFDSNGPPTTTPLALSAVGGAGSLSVRDHTHQSPGGIASLTSPVSISNTQINQLILSAEMPPSMVNVGTVIRATMIGTGSDSSSSDSITFSVTVGVNGTSSDANVDLSTTTNSGSASTFQIDFYITFRTVAAGSIVEAFGILKNSSSSAGISNLLIVTTGAPTNFSPNPNGTGNVFVTLRLVNGANTISENIQLACIEIVKM